MHQERFDSYKLLEMAVQDGPGGLNKIAAREAVLDCALFIVEAANLLGLRGSAAALDVVADVAFLEVFQRPLPKTTLPTILMLAEAVKNAPSEGSHASKRNGAHLPVVFSSQRNRQE